MSEINTHDIDTYKIDKAEVIKKIEQQLHSDAVVLYMKGTPKMPECGFSAKVVQILNKYLKSYTTVNILENPDIREVIKEYSKWPTFPQLYVDAEIVGGCDIIKELDESGELKQILNQHNK